MSELAKRWLQPLIRAAAVGLGRSRHTPDLGDTHTSNFPDILPCNESVRGNAERRRCRINPHPGKVGRSWRGSAAVAPSGASLAWTSPEAAGQTGHLVKLLIFSRVINSRSWVQRWWGGARGPEWTLYPLEKLFKKEKSHSST